MTASLVQNTFDKRTILDCVRALEGEIDQYDRFFAGEELERIVATMRRIPVARSENDHIVDIGGTVMWVHLYSRLLNYNRISLVQKQGHLAWSAYRSNFNEERLIRDYGCEFVAADVDKDPFGIPSDSANCVVCFEVLEHLQSDPMHLISEANRILANDGILYVSTPNVIHDYNLVKFLFGNHPFSWAVYTSVYGDRHNREFTPFELMDLLVAGGFDVNTPETLTFRRSGGAAHRILGWLLSLGPAATGRVPFSMRGAFSHVKALKAAPVRDRYPAFLYDLFGAERVFHDRELY